MKNLQYLYTCFFTLQWSHAYRIWQCIYWFRDFTWAHCIIRGIFFAHWNGRWIMNHFSCSMCAWIMLRFGRIPIICLGLRGESNFLSRCTLLQQQLLPPPPTTTKETLLSTSGVQGVSVLALTLGIGFVMCEHAGVLCMPTQKDSSKVESCLRGQWEYLHVAISIKT